SAPLAAGEMVDPDDRHGNHPLHASPLTSLVQVSGRGGEEFGRRRLVGRGPGGYVDDDVHTCQRFGETGAGDDIPAGGTRHCDDIVSAGLEHVDDMTAN